jgi:hypothetical protein
VQSAATTRRRPWQLAGLAAGLVAGVALVAIAAFQFSGKLPDQKSDSGSQAQKSAAAPDSAGGSTGNGLSDTTRWDDGTDSQVLELQSDISDLEAQTATDDTKQ